MIVGEHITGKLFGMGSGTAGAYAQFEVCVYTAASTRIAKGY